MISSVVQMNGLQRSFRSVNELNAKIRTFITGWNDRCHPFVWTKPADQILAKANRQNTSETVR
jgi:hypothetical protein